MTGLDKILDQIRQESDAAVAEKLAEANKNADEIREKARAEVIEECKSIEAHGTQQAEDTISRAESAAQLYKRKAILAEKQRIIAEIFDKAEERLQALPEEEYFNMIIRIAIKNALPQDGKIIFSAADSRKVPDDFEMRLNAQLKSGRLAVSEETRELGGGFVLSYGGIEENCTFRALIDAERETMADKIQAILFN